MGHKHIKCAKGVLSGYKIVAFDFDDTLAVHKDKDYAAHRKALNEDNYFRLAYLCPDDFYEKIEPCTAPTEMQNFICYLRTLGSVKLYCISGMKHTLHYKAKEAFIHKHYGLDIELIASGSQERKADVLRVLQSVNNCNPDEVLFVDDRQTTVDFLCKQGFNAILASDIPTLSPDRVSFTSLMDN